MSAPPRPRLITEGLSVHFGDRSALDQIEVAFDPAETVAVIGPNGAGKSTLLQALAGMIAPSHGRVRLDGISIQRPQRGVVFVPQRSGVEWRFPISVLEVAAMGVGLRQPRWRPTRGRERDRAWAALERVGMAPMAGVQIGALSGGQQQRVVLARALAQEGNIYLLDEPFGGVDGPTQQVLAGILGELAAAGKTIVYATHDLTQAATVSDRVLLLNRRVIADGPPRRVLTADNLTLTYGGRAVVPFPSRDEEPVPRSAGVGAIG